MQRSTLLRRVTSTVALLLAAGAACGVDFQPVPPLPGGQISVVSRFSADGAAVLGSSKLVPGDSGTATRFDLVGASTSGLGANTNVSVAATGGLGLIVGNGPSGPFRVQSGVTQGVNLGAFASVADMSGDGTVLVGNNLAGAFIYDNAALAFSGSVVSLGKLAGFDGPLDSLAVAGLAGDSSVIAGTANRFVAGDESTPDSFEFAAAWRPAAGAWTRVFPASGPGSKAESYAEAVSDSGVFVAGYARATPSAPFAAFVYRVAGGTVTDLPASGTAFATAVIEVPGGPAFTQWAYVGGTVETPQGTAAVVWQPAETAGVVTYTAVDLNTVLPPEFAGWRLTGVRDLYLPAGADQPLVTGSGLDPDGKERAWVLNLASSSTPTCVADFNGDTFLNLDDLGDFISDFYSDPPIPGGLQPDAPSYSDVSIGFGVPCPNAGDAPAPYDVDAFRTHGYRVGYSADGGNACPQDPSQPFPNLDNLNDFVTFYYESFGNPGSGC